MRYNSLVETGCPFCDIELSRIVLDAPLGFCIRDGYPVSPLHSLIIPKRHVASFFDLTMNEERELLGLLQLAKHEIEREKHPDGFNIGINEGLAAGQTVMHLHIHLIPRYKGDQPDPRGGVRWIFPDKAVY